MQGCFSAYYLLLVFFIQIFTYYVWVCNLYITLANTLQEGVALSPIGKTSFDTFTSKACQTISSVTSC